MENDPNKKESKGKRILKKATRRNSKSSNTSQNSALSQSVAVSRSKSFENKRLSIEINDSTPLPTPDGTTDKADHAHYAPGLKIEDSTQRIQDNSKDELKLKKTVDIKEDFNTIHEEVAEVGSKNSKTSPKYGSAEIGTSKKYLKRVGLLNPSILTTSMFKLYLINLQ